MEDLMVHCGGNETSLLEVGQVEVPEATVSYTPVANMDLIDMLEFQITRELGVSNEDVDWSYALSGDKQQLFGIAKVNQESNLYSNQEMCLSIGFRNSYNKTLRVGIVSGASVFVCDNLCFNGSDYKHMRKHTAHVHRDLFEMVRVAVSGSIDSFERSIALAGYLKRSPVDTDRGYELIGRAMGHKVLMPRQAADAMKDWKKPRHAAFESQTMWSLYNCFTEGIKKGQPGRLIDRAVKVTDFFEKAA